MTTLLCCTVLGLFFLFLFIGRWGGGVKDTELHFRRIRFVYVAATRSNINSPPLRSQLFTDVCEVDEWIFVHPVSYDDRLDHSISNDRGNPSGQNGSRAFFSSLVINAQCRDDKTNKTSSPLPPVVVGSVAASVIWRQYTAIFVYVFFSKHVFDGDLSTHDDVSIHIYIYTINN